MQKILLSNVNPKVVLNASGFNYSNQEEDLNPLLILQFLN